VVLLALFIWGVIMSKVGKIVLDNNYSNPYLVISDSDKSAKGLKLVTMDKENMTVKLSREDARRLNYRGRKLDGRSVDLTKVMTIYNLNIREIGVLSEKAYCKLLRQFVSYHASRGATDSSYLQVRDDVHNQLIKMMNKTK
jgi:hypothetical protein